MKILFIAPQPYFRERGTPIRARHILIALSMIGCEIDLLTYPFGRDEPIEGVNIIRCGRPPFIHDVKVGPSLAKFPLDAFLYHKAKELCRNNQYDIIEAVEEAALFAPHLKRLSGARLVYHMDSFLSDQLEYSKFFRKSGWLMRWARYLERKALHATDLAVVVSNDVGARARKVRANLPLLQLEDAPLHERFPDAFEKAETIKASLGIEGRKVVVYTGNFTGYQGVELLIESAAFLRKTHPEAVYVLVGEEGQKLELMKTLARNSKVEDMVRFTGVRPSEEIPSFLFIADVLVSPRCKGGNTPMKIYEYMQSNSPIVATRLSTHTEVLDDTCAELVEVSAEGLAGGIGRVLEDPEYGRRIALAATERLEQNYSLAHFRKRIQDAICNLAAHGQVQAPGSVSAPYLS